MRGKVCSVCGDLVLSAYAEMDAQGRTFCPVCRRIQRPFRRAVAYGSYDGGLRDLIHLLKYNGVRPAANVLGRMLAESLAGLEDSLEKLTFEQAPILVIPVPLYKAKYRQRGFNQSELIAQTALKLLPPGTRFELATNLLQRRRETASQIGLTAHARRANLRGAFAVNRAEVAGREVLVVDDVYTTGATATECAQVLRRAGASSVYVATVARTMKFASKYEAMGEVASGVDEAQASGQQPGSGEVMRDHEVETMKY